MVFQDIIAEYEAGLARLKVVLFFLVLFFLRGNNELGEVTGKKNNMVLFFWWGIMSRSRLLKNIRGPVFSKWED